MIGLGRMGANMVRRLMKAGHPCVVYDRSAEAVAQLAAEGAVAAASLRRARGHSWPAPRAVWLMVPAAVVDAHASRPRCRCWSAGDIADRRRQLVLPRRHPPRQGAGARAASTTSTCGTSGGVWGLERGYCLMIGGAAGAVQRLDPIFAHAGPGPRRASRARRAREAGRRHGRAGLPALRAERRRPLREDGPQRHRVRPDGRLCRGPHILQVTPTSASARTTADAETTPLRDPEHYQYDLDLPDIAEVWRRGSVIASWLLDLTAAALVDDPQLREFAGRVSDSGEGRWTIKAAIDEAVPAPVLTAALYERFASRGEAEFQNRCCRRCASSSAATTRSRR